MAISSARESLIDFSILTNQKKSYDPNWHHELIAQKLEAVERGEIKRLILMLPPRHGKSQLATINFPAWYLGRNPTKEIITASYSGDLAVDFGSKTRDLIDSEAYQTIFKTKLKEDEKSKAKWRTEAGGSYTSVGVGGAITGKGADIFIIDDPIKNREEADSEVYRDKTWDWFTSTAYTRLEPGAAIILILTRWHFDDVAGRILEPQDGKESLGTGWEVVRFPAIADTDEEYRKRGEALWPVRFDLDALDDIKKTVGSMDWAALYQQTPLLTEDQEFKPIWFKYRPIDEMGKIETRNFLTVDTAISKTSSSDSTGLCLNFVDRENHWNLKAWRMKLNPKELIDLLFNLQTTYNLEKIGIEKTIYLDAIKPFLDEEMRKRNKFLTIVELHHNQTAKETRIRGLIPRYETGSVHHITRECKDLEDEMLVFPKGIHDDVLDATAYQLQIAEAPFNDLVAQVQMRRNRAKKANMYD